jgi:hypothetical protein
MRERCSSDLWCCRVVPAHPTVGPPTVNVWSPTVQIRTRMSPPRGARKERTHGCARPTRLWRFFSMRRPRSPANETAARLRNDLQHLRGVMPTLSSNRAARPLQRRPVCQDGHSLVDRTSCTRPTRHSKSRRCEIRMWRACKVVASSALGTKRGKKYQLSSREKYQLTEKSALSH